jgi:hypothetical protein
VLRDVPGQLAGAGGGHGKALPARRRAGASIYTVQPPALTAFPCAETAKLQRTRGRQGHVSLTMGVPPMLHIIVSSPERASMVFSLTYPSFH